MAARVLIVRLGATGDLVHALPAVAAIRDAWPDARLDWLVSPRYAPLLRYASGFDRAIVMGGLVFPAGQAEPRDEAPGPASGAGTRSAPAWWRTLRLLRAQRYDLALDFQGLIKSAVLARASGAARVLGFPRAHLREPAARLFYTEAVAPGPGVHVVHKNLGLVRALGITPGPPRFPLSAPLDDRLAGLLPAKDAHGRRPFAIVNPGAGWPNKRWPPARFAALAAYLRDRHGLPSLVTWGPGERDLAEAVVAAAAGTARMAPATSLGDMIALVQVAALFVAGDTGPLQLAAALETPIVAIFGPTSPARNGPWSRADISLSRFDACECHHKRRCRRPVQCIDDIALDEVFAAVDRRLAAV